MRALRSALVLTAGVALGLALALARHRLGEADGPPRHVVVYLTPDGQARVYGPATRARAEVARRIIGGRVVKAIGLP